MQLAVFDFCETLVNFQSADRFVDYVIEKENYRKYAWIQKLAKGLTQTRILAITNQLFPKLNASKRLKLLQLKGIANDKIEQYAQSFYDEKIIPNRIQPIYERMQQHVAEGDYVIVISGGYAPYIKIFSQENAVKSYFATQMGQTNKLLTGRFSGKDCLYGQKRVLLNEFLNKSEFNFTKKIAYSDSITDLPLLQWADEAFVISRKKSQPWAKKYGFKEIIHD